MGYFVNHSINGPFAGAMLEVGLTSFVILSLRLRERAEGMMEMVQWAKNVI